MAEEEQAQSLETIEGIDSLEGTMEKPQNLDRSDRSGVDDIGVDEIKLPRLCIAQGLSPQVMPDEGNYIPGLVVGQMFNDITGDIYGSGPITIVPVFRHVTRIEFDPDNKGVPLDRNVPANDPRMRWTKNPDNPKKGVPPRATEYVDFVSFILRPGKAPDVAVVSIKTTNKYQRKTADLWTTLVGTRPTAIYTGMYKLSSKFEKGVNKEGQPTKFGVFVIKNAGYVPTDKPAGAALVKAAKELHAELKAKKFSIEREIEDTGDTSFDPEELERESQSAARNDENVGSM